MRARNRLFSLVSGAFFLSLAAQADPAVPALPQQAVPQAGPSAPAPPRGVVVPGQRYRGTVLSFDGPFLTLKPAESRAPITLGMTTATRIIHSRMLKLTDLQPGSFASVVVLVGADGKLRAQGIRSYPANMRGMTEGRYPIDPANPMRLLVGGTITAVTPGGIGGVFAIAFHGGAPDATGACTGRALPGGLGCSGAADIQFARGVPIVAIEDGDASMLLPGATVTATAAADPGGTPVASVVTVEREAPPPKP